MPGSLIVKPIEGKFAKNLDLIGKMDPYCIVHVGDQQIKGQVCKNGGKNPHWNETITIPRAADEPTMFIELLDKDFLKKDDLIGVCQIDLNSIPSQKPVSNWYPVFNNKQVAGEVLLEITYQPTQHSHGNIGGQFQPAPQIPHQMPAQNTFGQPAYTQPNYTQPGYVQPQFGAPTGGQHFGHQQQYPPQNYQAPTQGGQMTNSYQNAGGHMPGGYCAGNH